MWRSFFRKPSEADLAEELEAHLAIEARQLMDRGLPREQAEIEARRLLGSRALILEDTRAARGRNRFAFVLPDIRYAARILQRGRAFTIAAILSLALGIGATTAVFSIYDTIFLRPLPYKDPGQLIWVTIHFPGMGANIVPSPDYVAWRHDNETLQQLAATQVNFSNSMVLGGPIPTEVNGARVSANFFETFGVSPAAGRTFLPEEELPNHSKAVMLLDRFWRDHFHARRDVLGSTIMLDGQPYLVTGILPPSFVYPVDAKLDLLVTLNVSPNARHTDRNMSAFSLFGRLKPGVTISQARADLQRQFDASKADFQKFFRGDILIVQSLRDYRVGSAGKFLFILMGAAACLLAIACANVANLLLARWSSRARELAVRAAIGAGRGRLARQLFTEIGLLIAAGTLVGMIFVTVSLRGFVHFAGAELPRLSEVTTDFRVFGIAALVALLTAVLFGGLPALRARNIDPQSVLQQTGRGISGGHRFLRRTLVTLEIALSVVLLCGATLLFKTLWHMQYDHLGFQPEHVLTVSIPLRGRTFDGPARQAVTADVLAYVSRIPGTAAAALTDCSPISAGVGSNIFTRSDRPLPESFGLSKSIGICRSDSEYLKAAGIRLVQGRFLADDDLHYPGAIAVLNEAAARAYFAGEDPVGKQILGNFRGGWKTVVGVVADTKNQGLNHPAIPEVITNDPLQSGTGDLNYLVRTLANEGAFARALREEMRAGHPGLVTRVETLDQTISQLTANPRFDTVLLATFAIIAFLMAVVGVYGVLAFSVTQRRAEIGIRMALGASPREVLALVMKEGALLAAVGAVAGIGGSLFLTRYLATLLYGVKATDPATYALVVASLALAALAASFFPARKAAVVDPAITLRHE